MGGTAWKKCQQLCGGEEMIGNQDVEVVNKVIQCNSQELHDADSSCDKLHGRKPALIDFFTNKVIHKNAHPLLLVGHYNSGIGMLML